MKQSSIIILLTFLMNMVSAKVFAQYFESNNADGKTIYYTWNNDMTELSVVSRANNIPMYRYSGDIVIPEFVEYDGNKYPVTSIASSAFYKCDKLTSLTIPNGISIIEDYSFSSCI